MIYFVVQGRGDFPSDMLRYDDCVPIGDVEGASRRRVTLSTTGRQITDARWLSFGWSVVARASTPEEAERLAEEKMGAV